MILQLYYVNVRVNFFKHASVCSVLTNASRASVSSLYLPCCAKVIARRLCTMRLLSMISLIFSTRVKNFSLTKDRLLD